MSSLNFCRHILAITACLHKQLTTHATPAYTFRNAITTHCSPQRSWNPQFASNDMSVSVFTAAAWRLHTSRSLAALLAFLIDSLVAYNSPHEVDAHAAYCDLTALSQLPTFEAMLTHPAYAADHRSVLS